MSRAVAVRLALSALLLLVSACATFSPPIPVETTPADAELLAGEWYGHYRGDGPGSRRGTIVFTLMAGEDHAHGDVLMIPAGSTRAYERYHGTGPLRTRVDQAPSQVLTIRFVRAIDGAITGRLDPYWDPDRDCIAFTTFAGVLQDGTIAGTFTTACGAGPAAATGRWTVTRLPLRPPRR
jgi:hypothetical protein